MVSVKSGFEFAPAPRVLQRAPHMLEASFVRGVYSSFRHARRPSTKKDTNASSRNRRAGFLGQDPGQFRARQTGDIRVTGGCTRTPAKVEACCREQRIRCRRGCWIRPRRTRFGYRRLDPGPEPATRSLAEAAARHAGLALNEAQFAQLCAAAPYVFETARRLNSNDRGHSVWPARQRLPHTGKPTLLHDLTR